MQWATEPVKGLLRHFTTDQAVRAGVVTAAWSAAASYSRGLLPRTPVQQAAATGATMTAHYAVGATMWSAVASTASAGSPIHRPGKNAVLVAAALSAGGGKAGELALRGTSGQNIAMGSAWSGLKLLSVVGLSGGLVTASDLVVHQWLRLPRTPATTLALDLGTGGLMATGTLLRRRRRALKYKTGGDNASHRTLTRNSAGTRATLIQRGRSAAVVGGALAASSVGLGLLAVGEQAVARLVAAGADKVANEELGAVGEFLGHMTTFSGFALAAYVGVARVRTVTQRGAEIIEPAYQEPPTSPYVSAGPGSEVAFDAIGKEGRRFVLMALTADQISEVVQEPAIDPVRIVVPSAGTPQERAALACRELERTGGIERSVICVASPTGVGYVNFVMGEALEYLARGDCAVVVPQYAYVPSALALHEADLGSHVQAAVVRAIADLLARRAAAGSAPQRVVQFGESLGAEVAFDVGVPDGPPTFRQTGLESGIYFGMPFRSELWRALSRNGTVTGHPGVVVVSEPSELAPGRGRHVVINHHDDPIVKFDYSMVVQRPWWMGKGHNRPPGVPRETIFRPITTFVLTGVDVLNGMNMKPGAFVRLAHDYRIDMREGLQRTFDLPVNAEQAARIEAALRLRELEWAEKRLIAKAGEKAMRTVRETLNSWGQGAVNLELAEQDQTDISSSKLVAYLSGRFGSGTDQEPDQEAPAE